MSDDEIIRQFKRVAKNVWENASKNIDELDLGVKYRKGGCHMSLAYTPNTRPYAVGSSLIRMPVKATLIISDKARNLPKGQFEDLLRHEALHLGYRRHDEYFRRCADKLGIPMTVSMSEGGGYMVQAKEGSRFKTIKIFNTLDEASFYARELAHKEMQKERSERKKIRVSY